MIRRAIIRVVRPLVRKLLVAGLLTLCIGLQVLEASGRWDRSLKDTADEAVIVTVVLCIGAALVAAGVLLTRLRPTRVSSPIVPARTPLYAWPPTRFALSNSCASPPVGLRI